MSFDHWKVVKPRDTLASVGPALTYESFENMFLSLLLVPDAQHLNHVKMMFEKFTTLSPNP